MREAMRRSRRPQPPAPAPPTRVQARSIRGDAVAAGRGAAVLGSDGFGCNSASCSTCGEIESIKKEKKRKSKIHVICYCASQTFKVCHFDH